MHRIQQYLSLCFFLIVFTLPVSAKDVSGTVKDKETSEPIYGAAVFVKGMNIGTIVNEKGEWKLSNVPHDNFTLVIQMAGYRTVEVNATGGEVHVQLEVALFNVGEVVTTGTQTKQLYEETPVKTEVVPKRQIEAVQEADLYGVLQYTPGVRVENNCQNCSFTQLRMLGLEGGYSQILINSDPVVSTMAGVYGLQQFPEQMIDAVEVVKGGGSALYGANAIGGVVNIRLRRPMINRSRLSFDYKSGDGHIRSESGFYSEIVNETLNYGMFIFGNARTQNGYDRNDDGFTDIGKLTGESMGVNMYYQPTGKDEITAHFHRLHEDRRGGDRLSKPSHQANISEAAESYRWGGNIHYTRTISDVLSADAGYSFALAERATYYGAGMDPNAYGRTDNPVHYFSSKLNYVLGRHTFTGGATYVTERLFDEAVSYNRVIDDEYTDFGLILQDQIAFGKRANVVIGVRGDKHSLLDDPVFSPRVSALYSLSDGWKLRGNVSTGFKPPQVFDEDLHITQVNGEGQIIRNADDLAEEKSISFSGTLDYMGIAAGKPVQAGITGFTTVLDDQFQIVEADDQLTTEYEFERQNGNGLTVSGMELQFGIKPLSKVEIQGSATFQTEERDEADPDFGSKRLFRTPEQYGGLMVFYEPRECVSIFLGVNYTGSMKAPHYAGYIATDRLEDTDAFFSLDLGFTYELSHKLHERAPVIKAGIKNITDEYQDDLDKGIDRDAGYVYGPATPRMVYVGLEFGL